MMMESAVNRKLSRIIIIIIAIMCLFEKRVQCTVSYRQWWGGMVVVLVHELRVGCGGRAHCAVSGLIYNFLVEGRGQELEIFFHSL